MDDAPAFLATGVGAGIVTSEEDGTRACADWEMGELRWKKEGGGGGGKEDGDVGGERSVLAAGLGRCMFLSRSLGMLTFSFCFPTSRGVR